MGVIYLWKCQECGLTFERVNKGESKRCPQCIGKGCKTYIGAKSPKGGQSNA